MATVKARLQNLYRDLGRADNRWQSVVEEFGSAYSEAYKQHTENLPTELLPNQDTVLLAKVVAGVIAGGAGMVLSPITVAIVFTPISSGIEEIGAKLGAPVKPKKMHQTPSITPLKYQNNLKQYIRDRVTDLQDTVDRLIEKVDGLRPEDLPVNQADIDMLEKWVYMSPLMYPPKNYKQWNLNRQLEHEMEKLMWAEWAILMKKAGNLIEAGNLDIDKPLKRLQALKVISAGVKASNDYKVRLSVALVILRWAAGYKPKKTFGESLPAGVQRFSALVSKVGETITPSDKAVRPLVRATLKDKSHRVGVSP